MKELFNVNVKLFLILFNCVSAGEKNVDNYQAAAQCVCEHYVLSSSDEYSNTFRSTGPTKKCSQ